MQEVEIFIKWKIGERPRREPQNIPVFHHFNKEKGIIHSPSSPWGGAEISFFAGCGSTSYRRFEDNVTYFQLSFRGQERMTRDIFLTLMSVFFGATMPGKILRQRLRSCKTNEDKFTMQTRCVLCGGRENQQLRSVYTFQSERQQYPDDFPSAKEDGFNLEDNIIFDTFARHVKPLQQKYEKMIQYINNPNMTDHEFLVQTFSFCRLGMWFDINFESFDNFNELRRLLDK